MKAIVRISLLTVLIALVTITVTQAQRVIKGTVYLKGKPASGVTVEANRGGTMMTSFDGKYQVEADAKTKWIKFTLMATDESKKMDLDENSGDQIDFYFDDIKPETTEAGQEGVNLKSQEELVGDQKFAEEYTLYYESYRIGDYAAALPHWKKIYDNYPKSSLNLYINGIKMYQDFLEKSKTPEEAEKNLQELMKIYDKRIKYFGQKGYVLGRKAADWLGYKITKQELEGDARKEALKRGYEWVSESVTEQGNDSEAPVLVLLMQTSRALFQMGDLPKETVVKNYDKCTSIINYVLANEKDASRVARFTEIQPYIESIFGSSGAADCEALANIYTPQFKEKSNDIEFLKTMLQKLRRAKCDESDLFDEATEKLYQLEPSAEAAFNMAHRYVRLGDDAKAKEYYKQAMEQETDKQLLATYYYEYAYFIYAKEKAYQEARTYARKALEIKPDYCEANMLIGDIYVYSSASFPGTDLQQKAIFWLADDYYQKARQGDDCAIEASQKIRDHRKYFPSKEDAFMEGLQTGQTYKVGGWINETTKVRF